MSNTHAHMGPLKFVSLTVEMKSAVAASGSIQPVHRGEQTHIAL